MCYTACSDPYIYLRNFSTDQQLAYLRQRDLSVIYGLVLGSYAYTSTFTSYTSRIVALLLHSTFYFFLTFYISLVYLLLIHLAGYLLCREI